MVIRYYMMWFHHYVVWFHHYVMWFCHYVMWFHHYVVWFCHYVMWFRHNIISWHILHETMPYMHPGIYVHLMIKPHHIMMKAHHIMVKPHDIMIKPHHEITNDHIRKLWLSIYYLVPHRGFFVVAQSKVCLFLNHCYAS